MKDINQLIVRAYIDAERIRGSSTATLHNKLASIRRVVRTHGKDPDQLGILAREIGLDSRSRKGTKEPISDADFLAAIEKAYQLNEPGLAIVLKLQRLLGHRGLESLMSIRDLEKSALEANEQLSLNVAISHGTKGGRYRVTSVIKARAQETIEAIREALVYAQTHQGFLIQGSKVNLKSAVSRYHRLAAKVGLTGIHSPHSLRYAYIVEKITEMRDDGLNKREALSLAAAYLGHGDSRARYVSMVYGKTVVHTLKPERRKKRLARAVETIDSIFEINDLDPWKSVRLIGEFIDQDIKESQAKLNLAKG